MRTSFCCLSVVLLAICGTASAARPAHPLASSRTGELILQFRDPAQSTAPLKRLGLSATRSLMNGRAAVVTVPTFMTADQAIRTLRDDPAIVSAEPNALRYIRINPNDPLFDRQWGFLNTGQGNFVSGGPPGTVDGDLNMLAAWDLDGDGSFRRTGDPSVIVAIIDDAFDLDHPDLAANFIAGRDAANNDSNPRPDDDADDQFHGTYVSGSLGAIGNNGIGVAGAVWSVSLMPLKVGKRVTEDGVTATQLDSAAILTAMQYALDHGAQIVNASYGGPTATSAERNLLKQLGDAGVLFVTSAGNTDANIDRSVINFPANYDEPNILTVAATNRQDGIASFSEYGPTTVDVAAPGLQIVTTQPGGDYADGANCGNAGGNCGVSGTSFSSPYAAGIATLIKSEYPAASYPEIKARLIASGEAGDGAGLRTSAGRIDAAAALDVNAQPVLVVRSVVIDSAGNGALDPGETARIDVTLENLWQTAVAVTARFDTDDLTVLGRTQSIGTLAQNETATVSFDVIVPSGVSGHRYVSGQFSLQANAGLYSVQRGFINEISALPLSETIQTAFAGRDADLYDDFHAWHVDVTDVPSGTVSLVISTATEQDIDLLVKYEAPPQYLISLGINPEEDPGFFCTSSSTADCDDPDTYISGEADGNEKVVIDNPQVGTYHIVVVNFAQTDVPLDYRISTDLIATSGVDEAIEPDSDDGGSLGLASLLPLLAATAWRRRRR
ncbi:S8 family serine peptidase [Algiphilus sp. W345]|uniref:S8 family serine peptidase n=1 Tax=Banduia mediterranea TaxID=3075609 RepID=A0ABU2WLR2_9GAMM|nr:S8 family serine peptidase [Algiphilus sp. W345]MDT0498554.1 S8 family serine peptidase [Algiphilus sp. W345]